MRPEDGMSVDPLLAPSAQAMTEGFSVLAGLCGGQPFCAFRSKKEKN
jgi:hypothetical protein